LGNPDTTILQALRELERRGVTVLRRSCLYRTSPYGPVDQPDFTNAVAAIRTALPPVALLTLTKQIEAGAGRRHSALRWGPRALDIDILDYNRQILNWPKDERRHFKCKRFSLILPHPGIPTRDFVLTPLMEVAPYWHHPVSGHTPGQLLKRLRFTDMGRIIP
jgi:2-amino-4-hydroxy-6-hydroxymethyldihydropteridine diphosphokinase